MAILNPFQLLEINIISAQDLEVVSKKMKTYAKAWVNPTRKLSTRVDSDGNNFPTWNDKFVFRVDEQFLREDTSAVMIEIYGVHWFRDKLIGTVHVLVGNLIPQTRPYHHNHFGMRFVALQVRRPSGRPQGILNIGVALLDSSMRSMPLYTQLSTSAVGYRVMMGEEDITKNNNNNGDDNKKPKENSQPHVKPILRRTKSERSERVTFENGPASSLGGKGGSIIGFPQKKKNGGGGGGNSKGTSVLSISEFGDPFLYRKKAGKASSVISGAELREKPKQNGVKKGKAGSVLSDSIISKDSNTFKPKEKESNGVKSKDNRKEESPVNKGVDEKSVTKTKATKDQAPKAIANGGQRGLKGNGKFVLGVPKKANSVWSDSEVGPSPSEVAAALMAERRYPLEQEERSSVLDGWSLDESVEGLRSKLERWRTELPPLYDRGGFSSSYRSSTQPSRKHVNGGGSGLFSCFGNICGYECQCICGKPTGRKRMKFHGAPSSDVGTRSFF